MTVSVSRLNPLQTDKTVIVVDFEEETTTDTIFCDEWNQAQGWKADSASALGDDQQTFCRALVVVKKLIVGQMKGENKLMLTDSAHLMSSMRSGVIFYRYLNNQGQNNAALQSCRNQPGR